jgi:stage IV sporulation protein FB
MLAFSIFGFPVRVHWTFWILAALVGGGLRARGPEDWPAVLAAVGVIFVSILVHELGHAVTGRKFGSRPNIMLFGMGGLCQLPGVRFTRPQHIAVSIAGPVAGFLLAGAVYVIAISVPLAHPIARHAVSVGLFVNIVWNVLNLLPILPLDGGQILRDLLGPRGHQAVRWIGAATALALAVPALIYGFYFGAIIAGALAVMNFQGRTIEGGVMTADDEKRDNREKGRRS